MRLGECGWYDQRLPDSAKADAANSHQAAERGDQLGPTRPATIRATAAVTRGTIVRRESTTSGPRGFTVLNL